MNLSDLGERHDLVELGGDLRLAHPHDGAVQKDVLAARQFGMKAGSDFQQRPDSAVNRCAPFRRPGNPRKNLQQRALACAVASDDANDFTVFDVERDVPQGPESISLPNRPEPMDRTRRAAPRSNRRQRLAQRLVGRLDCRACTACSDPPTRIAIELNVYSLINRRLRCQVATPHPRMSTPSS